MDRAGEINSNAVYVIAKANQGLVKKIEELENKLKRYHWIPVEEQPPKTEDGYAHVMVSMDDEFVCTTDYTDNNGFELWNDSGEVIAWMPLPEPYKPKK